MNLPAGLYEAYPNGQNDNTHFQTEGAKEVARLVFGELQKNTNKSINQIQKKLLTNQLPINQIHEKTSLFCPVVYGAYFV